MRLSEKCRKAAIQDPCSQLAAQEAAKRCAAQKDKPYGAYGRCMNANFELQLIEKCGKIVCPGDPFMVEDTGTSSISRTTQTRAGEGGQYSTHEESIAMKTSFDTPEGEEGGVDPSKMRLYLGLGIGVVVLLIMARK